MEQLPVPQLQLHVLLALLGHTHRLQHQVCASIVLQVALRAHLLQPLVQAVPRVSTRAQARRAVQAALPALSNLPLHQQAVLAVPWVYTRLL